MTTETPVSTRYSRMGTSSSSTTDLPNTNTNMITSICTSSNTSSNTNTSSISTYNNSTNTGNVANASTTTGTQTEKNPQTELPPLYCWVLDGGSKSSYAKIIDQSFLQRLLEKIYYHQIVLPLCFCGATDSGTKELHSLFVDESFLSELLESTGGGGSSPGTSVMEWTTGGLKDNIPKTYIVWFDEGDDQAHDNNIFNTICTSRRCC